MFAEKSRSTVEAKRSDATCSKLLEKKEKTGTSQIWHKKFWILRNLDHENDAKKTIGSFIFEDY